jgi:ubiquitin C-terminal hydrolase
MNAVMQCLAHLPPVLNFFFGNTYKLCLKDNEEGKVLICLSNNLFRLMWLANGLVQPDEFVKTIYSLTKWKIGAQQDDAEFFSKYLEFLDNGLRKEKDTSLGPVNHIFTPEIIINTKTERSFYHPLSMKSNSSIEDLLKQHQLKFNRLTPIIVFAVDPILEQGQRTVKNQHISLTLEYNEEHETHVLNLSSFMADSSPERGDPALYGLSCFTRHQGASEHWGHYIAYVRRIHPKSSETQLPTWACFNDAQVTAVDSRSAITTNAGKARLLFYSRI